MSTHTWILTYYALSPPQLIHADKRNTTHFKSSDITPETHPERSPNLPLSNDTAYFTQFIILRWVSNQVPPARDPPLSQKIIACRLTHVQALISRNNYYFFLKLSTNLPLRTCNNSHPLVLCFMSTGLYPSTIFLHLHYLSSLTDWASPKIF